MNKVLFLILPVIFVGCTHQSTLFEATHPPKTIHNDKCIGHVQFEVLQVLDNGLLAYICRGEEYKWRRKLVFIEVKTRGAIYFDQQQINLPAGKCPIYTGSYTYKNKEGDRKTVAVVEFVDSQIPNPAYAEWEKKQAQKTLEK